MSTRASVRALRASLGKVTAPPKRGAPGRFTGTIVDAMDAAGLAGPTWAAWRAFWRAVFALPMGPADRAIFTRHTDRQAPPAAPVREVALPVGRRAGKSRNAAVAGLFLAISFDVSTLAPGETAVVPIISADRKQARQVLGYLKALFRLAAFAPYVKRTLKESVELRSGVVIEVHTASYRTTRGYSIIGCVCDEVAFWRTDDGSANPDSEVLKALRPGMATVPGALLLLLSSPYKAEGELYRTHERSFGQDDPDVLVWNADALSMNPTLSAQVVARAFETDPAAAASEYGRDGRVQFRADVEAFLDADAVRAVTVGGRIELAPESGREYVAFTDPSGGSRDSFTLAIAHAEGDTAILDAVRERRPPFSPDAVVQEYAALLASYGLVEVVGDRYAGEWPREAFSRYGVKYTPSTLVKSAIYGELLAPVNSGRVALLDLPSLRAQLIGLERRTARGGKDSIDHPPGGRDDVANAAAGALTLLGSSSGFEYTEIIMASPGFVDGFGFGALDDRYVDDEDLRAGWRPLR
jgi:hypothetical protein